MSAGIWIYSSIAGSQSRVKRYPSAFKDLYETSSTILDSLAFSFCDSLFCPYPVARVTTRNEQSPLGGRAFWVSGPAHCLQSCEAGVETL